MKKVLFFILLLMNSVSSAQNVSQIKLEEIINRFVRMSSEEEESSTLYAYYENIHEHPIDLNRADYASLSRLPVLDYYSIDKIIEYRERHKNFNSTLELYRSGIRKDIADMILPFVTVGESAKKRKMNFGSLKIRSYGISKYPEKPDGEYLGNNYKINNRVKLNYSDMVYINALTDKDAGEKGLADFYSYNLAYKSEGIVRKVIFGSFTVEFGQGLAVWSPYAFSKSADAVNSVVRNPHGISAYRSSGENRFLFGGAAKFGWRDFHLTSFYSSHKTSAITDSIGFTSLNMSGLFRTPAEILDKENLTIKTEGLIAGYKNRKKNITVNFLYLKNSFSRLFYSKVFPEDLFRNEISAACSFRFKYKRLRLAGEVSSTNGIIAQNYSARFFVSKNVNIITAFRYYPENYFALFSNGFGERKNTNNEKGIYNGIRISTSYGKLNFYHDFNKTLSQTTTEPFPVKRNDYLVDFYSPRFSFAHFRIRYHQEKKEHYLSLNDYVAKKLSSIITRRGRFALYLNLKGRFRLSSELNISSFTNLEKSETGYSISEEIRSKLTDNFIFYGRITFFDTPSYDSRIYLYENDINGVFNMGMLYGKGISEYILIKYEMVKGIVISAKYSETTKLEWAYNPANRVKPQNTNRRIAVEVETRIGER
jgi:hypothetical protein